MKRFEGKYRTNVGHDWRDVGDACILRKGRDLPGFNDRRDCTIDVIEQCAIALQRDKSQAE